jgi:hypothetical protein
MAEHHIGFGDFRRKGAHARSLRLGEDASRHLVLYPQAFHRRFPVPLGGQAIAPSGLEALAAARSRPPAPDRGADNGVLSKSPSG